MMRGQWAGREGGTGWQLWLQLVVSGEMQQTAGGKLRRREKAGRVLSIARLVRARNPCSGGAPGAAACRPALTSSRPPTFLRLGHPRKRVNFTPQHPSHLLHASLPPATCSSHPSLPAALTVVAPHPVSPPAHSLPRRRSHRSFAPAAQALQSRSRNGRSGSGRWRLGHERRQARQQAQREQKSLRKQWIPRNPRRRRM